ncbi:MAG: TonB-dependent receptor domain-containing protein [Succinivibrionaceae bacterium]
MTIQNKLLWLSLFVPSVLFAQNDAIISDDLVVSAKRLPQTKSSSLVNIDVVSSEEISQKGAKTVLEAVEMLPSVQISIYGSRGQASSLSIRGGKANQVLILLDGNPLNSSGIDSINLNRIPSNIVERIEYLRGYKATTYGANAISGVINIITKPEYKQKQKAIYSYGTYATHDFSMQNVITIGESSLVKITGGVNSSDGYNVHPVVGLNDANKHGYKSKNIEILGSHVFDNNLELWGSYTYSFMDGDYDNSWGVSETDRNTTESNRFSVGSNFKNDVYSYEFGVFYENSNDYNYIKGTSKLDPYTSSQFKLNTVNGHFVNEYEFIKDSLLAGFGVEYVDNVLTDDSSAYGIKFNSSDISIVNKAAFIFINADSNLFVGELSGRVDDNSIYDDNWTYSVGAGIKPHSLAKVVFRTGSAFRAPTLSELYYPNCGNDKLEPEKSQNYEISVSGSWDTFTYNVNAFYQDFDNLIGFEYLTYRYINLNEVRIKGVDLSLQYSVDKWLTAKISAMLIDPKDKKTDKTIDGKSKQQYKVSLIGDYAKADYFVDYQYNSKRLYDSYSSYLPSYSLVNLGLGYTVLQDKVRFGLSVNNLFDKKFEYYQGYPASERTFTGSITIQNLF